MCGIFGWWSTTAVPNGAQRSLQALQALLPRGPDEQHVWVNDERTVHLAHCRLKITGENGTQPLWNAQRSVAALVNGQFYNYSQLRNACENNQYVFQTDSDSELLLALYEQYGVDCLTHLDGEFAFILWDRNTNSIFAARDRSGVKPLKYIHTSNEIVFASEAKAFFASGWQAKWDPIALTQSLTFQYASPQRTLFKNIEQIAPGEYIQIDLSNFALSRKRWWHWNVQQNPSKDCPPQDYLTCLRAAMEQRLDGAWPTAVHLSAGCDSTTALVMAHHLGQPITAFSVGFETEGGAVVHDESEEARATAEQLGVPFEKVVATRLNMCEHWKDAIGCAEQLGINGHLVAKWLLARTIHEKGFRVSISGEGADETLSGYAFLTAEMGGNIKDLANKNPVTVGLMLPDTDQLHFPQVAQHWGFVPVWLQAKASLGFKLRTLMKSEWIEQYGLEAESDWVQRTQNLLYDDNQTTARSTWSTLALGGYILPALADAPEAGHQIQGRVPFLAKDVMAAALACSAEDLGYPYETKKPLRDFLRDNNLQRIADRPKHPFQAPPLLGDVNVQQHLRALWSAHDAWDDTPFCPHKISQWMEQWENWDRSMYQKWEPVVSTVLSVYWMKNVFNLKES